MGLLGGEGGKSCYSEGDVHDGPYCFGATDVRRRSGHVYHRNNNIVTSGGELRLFCLKTRKNRHLLLTGQFRFFTFGLLRNVGNSGDFDKPLSHSNNRNWG